MQKMTNDYINKRILLGSTMLFLLGLFLGTRPDFDELFILNFKETFVVLFGYLPTVGIAFTFMVINLVDKKQKFLFLTISTYTFLQYIFIAREVKISIGTVDIKPILLASLGAFLTLFFFRSSSNEIILTKKNYLLTALLGALTFLPLLVRSNVWTIMTSIYLWQITNGHYFQCLTKAQQPTNSFAKAGRKNVN